MQLAPAVSLKPTVPTPVICPKPIHHLADVTIGYALNGIAYRNDQLFSSPADSVDLHTTSLKDATRAVQLLLASEFRDAGGYAIVLGENMNLLAQPLLGSAQVLHALSTEIGTGGIASVQFTSRSKSLVGIVTNGNVITDFLA